MTENGNCEHSEVSPPNSNESSTGNNDRFDFPKEELKILDYWDSIDAFQTSLKLSKDRPRYTFLDGPPFATGLPHYGHLLAATIKDTVLRFASMNGFHVERRFGWDCHGLPVEYEIDKKLDIKSREDIMKMGIAAYNNECRSIVMRYSGEWEATVRRSGRWIDFKNDSKTMYPWFMESVWWVFRQLFDKGQIYRGFRVMPYSTACTTPLSNFEVALNYKDTQDPAVTVALPLKNVETKTFLLIWTTTPWTLPSNLAVCVNPELDYVFVNPADTDVTYVVGACLVEGVLKSAKITDYKIIKTVKGQELEGLAYEPMFNFFIDRCQRYPKTFTVVTDPYVTAEAGTGLVHQAPAFGEDDYNVCMRYGIISETDVPCPIDDKGCFMEAVETFKGQFWKDANNGIIRILEENGRLFHRSQITHSYPFCWRSDTPLIYRTIPCWFVRVTNIIPQLLQASAESRWVPDFVQEKRFHNWLAGARDWAVSRNRFWGTPIPIWASEDFEELVCIESIGDLERLSGVTGIKDLHRESIDHITIPSKSGKGVLRRVDEVLDCWFESGSVPYAMEHYPFENKERFEENFPADFIAEGLDQTRGWFYTLTVLGVHLFGKVPFKNLIVNGLVLAADGKKMSKRLKNYPEPNIIFDNYGADALRLYLINSPVVRAEPLKFKEEGVRNIIKDVLLPWYNSYRFLANQIESYTNETKSEFKFDPKLAHPLDNTMDAWILASLQTLIENVRHEMDSYRLYAVVSPLLTFIESLTNWYIRFNRRRLKGENGQDEMLVSLNVLFDVVFTFCKLMAPFTPIFSENIYLRLRPFLVQDDSACPDDRSVHFMSYPMVHEKYFNDKIERAFSRLQSVVERVRTIRESKNIPLKTPLKEVVVLTSDKAFHEDLDSLRSYVVEELNVRQLTLVDDENEWGISYKATPNFRLLGQRLKKDLASVQRALTTSVTSSQLKEFLENGRLVVLGHELTHEEVEVVRMVEKAQNPNHAVLCEKDFIIFLDVTVDGSLREEGIARELVNRVQRLRKKAGLKPTDDVKVFCQITKDLESEVKPALENQIEYICKALKSQLVLGELPKQTLISDSTDLSSGEISLALQF